MESFIGVVMLGMLTKGLQITIDKKALPSRSEYNASTVDSLPDEVRDYAEKHNGYIKT